MALGDGVSGSFIPMRRITLNIRQATKKAVSRNAEMMEGILPNNQKPLK